MKTIPVRQHSQRSNATAPSRSFPGRSGWATGSGIIGLLALGLGIEGKADVFSIRPIMFIDEPDFSLIAAGSISTLAGTSSITDWDLTVTTLQHLAHYSQRNTVNLSAGGFSSDGSYLRVATSPDGFADGGSLFFRSPNPFKDFGTALADFTGPNAGGGQALYMAGGNFDFLDLNQPVQTDYLVAQASAPGGNRFDLLPIQFSDGVTLSGTLWTDGTTGPLSPANITAWDFDVQQVTVDVFNSGNSQLQAALLDLIGPGAELTVDNPEGLLAFSKGNLGSRPYVLQLADFTDSSPRGGQARYLQGRLAAYSINLGASNGPWQVSGVDPISAAPESSPGILLFGCLSGLAGAELKRRRRL